MAMADVDMAYIGVACIVMATIVLVWEPRSWEDVKESTCVVMAYMVVAYIVNLSLNTARECRSPDHGARCDAVVAVQQHPKLRRRGAGRRSLNGRASARRIRACSQKKIQKKTPSFPWPPDV